MTSFYNQKEFQRDVFIQSYGTSRGDVLTFSKLSIPLLELKIYIAQTS